MCKYKPLWEGNVSKMPCKSRTLDVFMLHYSSVQIKVDLVFLFSFKLKALNTNEVREWLNKNSRKPIIFFNFFIFFYFFFFGETNTHKG